MVVRRERGGSENGLSYLRASYRLGSRRTLKQD